MKVSRRKLLSVFVVASIVATGWLLTPEALVNSATAPVLPDDLDRYLADTEQQVSDQFDLIPDTEKRIRWQTPGVRTRLSVVYLHGFSATRQEIAPTAEIVADRLGANLFETRLTGHGHGTLPLHEVRAEDWLQDAAEALTIGGAIGEQIILIATSNGATLALAMIGHESVDDVAVQVLISPNLAPRDPAAAWLTRPAGPLIARLLVGDTRSWTAHNPQQEKYWSTTYPTSATVEMMRLVDLANAGIPTTISQDLLVFLSPHDQVISPMAAMDAFAAIDSPRKQLIEVDSAGDPSVHVLAGEILSPANTEVIADQIVAFIESRERRR